MYVLPIEWVGEPVRLTPPARHPAESGAQARQVGLAGGRAFTLPFFWLSSYRETGRPRGFGFVEMDSDGAVAAIEGF